MRNYLVYDNVTGEIYRSGRCQAIDIDLQVHEPNQKVMEITRPDTSLENYIKQNKVDLDPIGGDSVQPRTAMPTSIDTLSIDADGVDSFTISDIPNPTHLWIEGEGKWVVEDGVFEFTTETVGEYKISLFNNLYLPTEYTVNAS